MIRRNPQRLAWTVLILSFCACAALAISVPLAIRSFLTDSTDPAAVILQRQQGTPLLQRPNSADFVGVTDQPTEVLEGSVIQIDESTQAVLTMRDPGVETNLVVVQLYGNTDVTLRAANTPRFGLSPNPHRLDLLVTNGRIRINVLNDTRRPVAASVQSPQGEVTFAVGTYAVEVTNEELQVTVREGRATVTAQGTSVVIEPSQRARVELGQTPQGGLSGERPLLVSSFIGSLQPAWTIEHGPQDENEPTGTVTSATVAGRRAALFERTGPSHAETRLVRELNRDVTDASSLTLHFAVLLSFQDVPVCGSQGTECPMMVKIEYRDASDNSREWLHGFYAINDPNNVNKPICEICTRRFQHQRILRDTWFSYDSGNLMDILTVDGLKPVRIIRVIFYASGHSYQSAVTDVELLVQD